MIIAAMLRVKNEGRWITRVLDSVAPLCDWIFVLDDHSTDDTFKEALMWALANDGHTKCSIQRSEFDGLNETRDKNFLLSHIMDTANPDWVLHIDGDEVLEPAGIDAIRASIASNLAPAYSFQILYLWNNENTIRTDRWYKSFNRPSLFSTRCGSNLDFQPTMFGQGTAANLHCTNVPGDIVMKSKMTDARLIHYGYIDRDMRLAKYEFYNRVDPNNVMEDRYRHIVQGDIPEVPAFARLKHAGPLTLEPFTPQLRASEVSAIRKLQDRGFEVDQSQEAHGDHEEAYCGV